MINKINKWLKENFGLVIFLLTLSIMAILLRPTNSNAETPTNPFNESYYTAQIAELEAQNEILNKSYRNLSIAYNMLLYDKKPVTIYLNGWRVITDCKVYINKNNWDAVWSYDNISDSFGNGKGVPHFSEEPFVPVAHEASNSMYPCIDQNVTKTIYTKKFNFSELQVGDVVIYSSDGSSGCNPFCTVHRLIAKMKSPEGFIAKGDFNYKEGGSDNTSGWFDDVLVQPENYLGTIQWATNGTNESQPIKENGRGDVI